MPDLPTAAAPIPRHAEARLRTALADTRIVALVGPRQSGKTTLVRQIAAARKMEFVTLDDEQRRSFANTTRDVAGLADVAKTAELSRLLPHVALASGQILNLAGLARPLGVDGKTIDRWLTLLEPMFVVRRVRAWHRNDLKRLVKTPKLQFLDSGLLAALRRVTEDDVKRDRSKLGALLEGFVFSELAKIVDQGDELVSISHLRDRDQIEVDFVLERAGRVVGVEVKAAASVKPEDFRGPRQLQDATGRAFACGIVLHDGERMERSSGLSQVSSNESTGRPPRSRHRAPALSDIGGIDTVDLLSEILRPL